MLDRTDKGLLSIPKVTHHVDVGFAVIPDKLHSISVDGEYLVVTHGCH